MAYQNILYEKEDRVVTTTINRPEVHNYLSRDTARELHNAWRLSHSYLKALNIGLCRGCYHR